MSDEKKEVLNELFTRLQDKDRELKKVTEDRKRYMDRVELLERENKRVVDAHNAMAVEHEAAMLAVCSVHALASIIRSALLCLEDLEDEFVKDLLKRAHQSLKPIDDFTKKQRWEYVLPQEEPSSGVVAKTEEPQQNGTET